MLKTTLCLAVLLGLAADLLAFGGSGSALNPRTYTSPSSEYAWKVEPSNLYGKGEATYELTRRGTPVWKGKQPFTLYEAGATDDGLLAGYAYTEGLEGGREDGDFHVAILTTKGELRLNEKIKRESSRFLHADPTPLASGVIVDGKNDRFVVRVSDADINRARETWWTYQLSSGRSLGKFDLKSEDSFVRSPMESALVTGTPLVALHYWRYARPDVGARFALVDENRKEVWATNFAKDYQNVDEAHRWVREQETVVSKGSNQFSILTLAPPENITYSVQPDLEKTGTWVVKEISREPRGAVPPSTKVFPTQPLKALGHFTFGKGDHSASPIRDVMHFDMDARERIGFIRREQGNRYSFICVSPEGKLLRESALEIPSQLLTNSSPKVAWVKEDRWIVVVSRYGSEPEAAAWWVHVDSDDVKVIPGFNCPRVDSIVGSRDGGFVILATQSHSYSLEDFLLAYDEEGKERWKLREGQSENKKELFSPEDIAVTTSGKVAVLDNIRKAVQFFSLEGKFEEAIALEEKWRRKPSYPSDISADVDGGILLHDFNGSPPIVRMNAEGSTIGEFELKHPDGRIFKESRGIRTTMPDRIWVCDGECFLRVNAKGVVEFVLGPAPETDQLGDVAALTVDAKGQIYAVDGRTKAVHVYNEMGKRPFVCKPDTSDFTGKYNSPYPAVSSDGKVYLNREEKSRGSIEYIQFSSDGQRLGLTTFGLDKITEKPYALPAKDRFLVLGYHDAFLVDSKGTVLRKIQKRPNGNWLKEMDGASVAPDGSFAIYTGRNYIEVRDWEAHIYDATGEPVRTVSLPAECATPGALYTGKYIITRSRTDICLFDATGKPVLKFAPKVENFAELQYESWQFFSVKERRELWLTARRGKSVWRFELP